MIMKIKIKIINNNNKNNNNNNKKIKSTAVEWIDQHKLKIDNVPHLLDDFLFIALSSYQCQAYLDLFIALCNYLSIPLVLEKICGPATTLSEY